MSRLALAAVIAVLAVGTYASRLTGIVLGGRMRLPPALNRLLPLAAVAVLAALAAVSALTDAGHGAGFARPAGVLAGVLVAWRRAPFVLVVLVAAGVAAVLRLLGVR